MEYPICSHMERLCMFCTCCTSKLSRKTDFPHVCILVWIKGSNWTRKSLLHLLYWYFVHLVFGPYVFIIHVGITTSQEEKHWDTVCVRSQQCRVQVSFLYNILLTEHTTWNVYLLGTIGQECSHDESFNQVSERADSNSRLHLDTQQISHPHESLFWLTMKWGNSGYTQYKCESTYRSTNWLTLEWVILSVAFFRFRLSIQNLESTTKSYWPQ